MKLKILTSVCVLALVAGACSDDLYNTLDEAPTSTTRVTTTRITPTTDIPHPADDLVGVATTTSVPETTTTTEPSPEDKARDALAVYCKDYPTVRDFKEYRGYKESRPFRKLVQRYLQTLGHDIGSVEPDGIYGKKTTKAYNEECASINSRTSTTTIKYNDDSPEDTGY